MLMAERVPAQTPEPVGEEQAGQLAGPAERWEVAGVDLLGGDPQPGGTLADLLEIDCDRLVRDLRLGLAAAGFARCRSGGSAACPSCQITLYRVCNRAAAAPNSVSVAILYHIDPDLSTLKCV